MTTEQRKIKQAAMRTIPGAESAHHILPRAYCVAKPALYSAVFAVPHQDRESQVRTDPWVTVQNSSCKDVDHGDWVSIAYVCTRDGSGQFFVIPT